MHDWKSEKVHLKSATVRLDPTLRNQGLTQEDLGVSSSEALAQAGRDGSRWGPQGLGCWGLTMEVGVS